ncbi:MAG TPA: hypothetical protein VGL86_03810 [Polyangia bacterium]|jgi:hypothetical protein
MRWLACVVCVLVLSGCDVLFPEFAGNSDAAVARDGGVEDGGGEPLIAGVVCILGDVRDYRTCIAGAPGTLRISVEETRDSTTTDINGRFTLPLSQKLASATVGIVDPTNNYNPTVVPIHLTNGGAAAVALPIVSAQTLQDIELADGLIVDPTQGIFLGWAVDPSGTPVGGVATGNQAVLYDQSAANSLGPGTHTNNDGTVALFNVAPTTLTVTLTPPPTVAVAGDTFTLPIRSGALTASTLVLPPR